MSSAVLEGGMGHLSARIYPLRGGEGAGEGWNITRVTVCEVPFSPLFIEGILISIVGTYGVFDTSLGCSTIP